MSKWFPDIVTFATLLTKVFPPSSRSGAILPGEGDTDTPHSPNILHVIPPPGKPAEIFSTFESRSRERGLEILTLEMRPGPGIKII